MNWICGNYCEFNFTHVERIGLQGIQREYQQSAEINRRDLEGVDGWTDIFGCFPHMDENLRCVRRGKRALS